MTSPIRVLVVEDSLTIRKRIVEVLSADRDIVVVGEAADGKRGFELCRALRPDAVTLDMMMPVMTGLATTESIMAYCPTPILVVSASTNRGELFRTYDALAAGALDVLEKPLGDERDGAWEARLRRAVKLIARIKVITHLRARLEAAAPAPGAPQVAEWPRQPLGPGSARVVAIGGSTGAPGAVLEILRRLPRGFACPVLLVLHINEPFGAALAEWLDGQSAVPVRYARAGERLPTGTGCVLMAPPGRHLVVEGDALRLSDAPERHSCRPSVDVLFESLAARRTADATLAVLLTGMGRDGAAGLLAIRRGGGRTIAQDEATSVVFGMPHEAIVLGAAERVLALQEIAPAIVAGVARAEAP